MLGVVPVARGVALSLFVRWERRSEHPMLPLDLFRDRRFSVGSGAITAAFFVMFGFFFLMTQYLQFGRGYSPLEAGLASLPLALMFVAVSPRERGAGRALRRPPGHGRRARHRGRRLRRADLAHRPTRPTSSIAVAFAVLGAGMGITAAPATGEIMSSVPLSKAGVGSAVNDTTRELGGALGIALLGSVANSAYRSNVDLAGLGPAGRGRRTRPASRSAPPRRSPSTLPDGGAVVARAASAFTDAFNLANGVAVAIAVAAAAGAPRLVPPGDGDADPGEERRRPIEPSTLELAGVGAGRVGMTRWQRRERRAQGRARPPRRALPPRHPRGRARGARRGRLRRLSPSKASRPGPGSARARSTGTGPGSSSWSWTPSGR